MARGFFITFEGGELAQKLKSERIKEKRTGTIVRLWPDPKYFDSPNIPLPELEHLVRSKAYLLPGLTMILSIEGKDSKTWKYERGMEQYFEFMLQGRELTKPADAGVYGAHDRASRRSPREPDSMGKRPRP